MTAFGGTAENPPIALLPWVPNASESEAITRIYN